MKITLQLYYICIGTLPDSIADLPNLSILATPGTKLGGILFFVLVCCLHSV